MRIEKVIRNNLKIIIYFFFCKMAKKKKTNVMPAEKINMASQPRWLRSNYLQQK